MTTPGGMFNNTTRKVATRKVEFKGQQDAEEQFTEDVFGEGTVC